MVGTEIPTWATKGHSVHYGGQRARVEQLTENLDTMVDTGTQVGQSSAVGQANIVGTEARVGQLQETVGKEPELGNCRKLWTL